MQGLIRHLLVAAAAACATVALAQSSAPADGARFAPPPSYTAPAEPQPDETNAQRARTQPGNNAPFWRGVRDSGDQPGISNLPGAEKGVLVQPFVQYPGSRFTTAGEAWRQVRNQWIIPYGGALLIIAALALALFHWRKGPLGHATNTDGHIERFTYFERAAHWSNAIAFCVLAISGIVMAFGQFFLLPIMGATLFGWLSYALKTLHNFAGPLFAVSLVIVFFTFVRDELPSKGDGTWLRKGGGAFSGEHVPAHRFNAGEKIVFWLGVFLLGALVVASGLVLDMVIPGLAYLRSDMQVAHMVHSIAAMFMMALFFLHIYLGTIGMRGAYRGMRDGYVDAAWAKEHHDLWYDDIEAGRIPARRSAEPPPAPVIQP